MARSGARRLAVGAAGMVVGYVLLLGGALLAAAGPAPADAILPPLEHAVNVWILLWAGWALLDAESDGFGLNNGLAALLLLAGAGYAYTAAWWFENAGVSPLPFSKSALGTGWTFAALIVCLGCAAWLLARYRAGRDVPLRVVFFAVASAGHAAALVQIAAGRLSYVGVVRWGMVAALPVFVALVYRRVFARLASVPAAAPLAPSEDALAAPRILQAVDLMLSEREPEKVAERVALTVATLLKADMVVVMSVEDRWADVVAAYDHIRQKFVMGLAVNLDEQPTLTEALDAGHMGALLPNRHANEIIDLYARLDLSETGPVYFQPIVQNGDSTGVLVVALPYSGRTLTEDEQKLLGELAPLASSVLWMADQVAAARFVAEVGGEPGSAAESARRELQEAREHIDELTDRVRNLRVELDYERGRRAAEGLDPEAALSISQQMEALQQEREALAEERDRLQAMLTEAETAVAAATAADDDMVRQTMVEMLSREKAELEAERDDLQSKLDALADAVDMEDEAPPAQAILESLVEEKEHLAAERDQLAAKLEAFNVQFAEQGTAGLGQLLGKLYDERAQLKAQVRRLTEARDTEKTAPQDEQIRRLASDREALTVQRDALRRERDHLADELEEAHARAAALESVRDVQEEDLQKAVALARHLESKREELGAKVSALEADNHELTAQSVTLAAERDQLRAQLAGREEALQSLNVELQSVEALRDLVSDLSRQRADLEATLSAARLEASDLRAKLEETQQNLAEVETAAGGAIEEAVRVRRAQMANSAEVIASTAQELRTPMSSIMGYTDLLLSESVGILGAMQRNFLQRVKTNTERMGTLIDDLVRVTTLDTGPVKLAPEPVDALEVIEGAITKAGNQFRDRGVTLRMTLEEDLPPLHADRDAFQQIMSQLLYNACLASPPQGEVALVARQQESAVDSTSNGQCLLVSVSDRGGGVDPDDMERVFSRKYRAENPLVDGLGDTGVGLSVAKTLVEAHGGRIWMESTPDVGTTFMFVIPFAPKED